MLSSPHLVLILPLFRVIHLILSIATCAVWVGGVGLLVLNRRQYRALSTQPALIPGEGPLPSLSILVPACNEAAAIEPAMRSLLALQFPCMEIIAVDDRSTDATGEILDRLALEDSRLRVLHIDTLPPGWLGKNHALHVAAESAKGDWLLFTDADVVYKPHAVALAVRYAHRRRIDHLVVSPQIETYGFWERLFVSYFALMFSFRTRPWEVANPRRAAYVGFGAFNMVRAKAYRQFGGHGALPMEVADDTKLGKLIKRNGLRTELMDGSDLMSVRWLIGLRGVMSGLTKNAYAGFDFSIFAAVAAMVGLGVSAFYPFIGLATGPVAVRWLATGSILGMVAGAAAMRRISGAAPVYALGYPLAALMLISIITRSIWRANRLNGVVWRGTLYPLDELKRGTV